jgi:O-6-methylguanine DNA methyltransferase
MQNNFSTLIYSIVREIPKGKVLTYKQVAEKANRPKAWRAVGNILNKNNDSTVPCHRVIKSNGKVGGYNKGTANKKILLKKEGIKSID